MSKYTKIDKETCIACGSCSAEAPEIFGEDDAGIAFSMLDDNQGITPVDVELEEDLQYAQESCPTESVRVEENPFN